MSSIGHKTIEKRRAQEDVYRAMEQSLAAEKRQMEIATWENSSAARQDGRNRVDRVKEIQAQQEKEVLRRRQELANLYNNEMDAWRTEVMSRVETQEDRKSRIMERAYALRDAREETRRKVVQERLDEQWRDACDDARLLDSKALTLHMSKERHQQIQDKIMRNKELSRNENDFMIEWQRQLEVMHQKDQDKRAKQHKADLDTAAGLRDQMAFRSRTRDEEYDQEMKDAEQELIDLREAMRKEAEKQQKRHDDEVSRGREIHEYNKQFKILSAQEARTQAEQDAILLHYAMQKEREKDAEEKAKREGAREAARTYKKYLEEQMVKEAEDTAFVDEVRKREEERVWKARDDALQAREDARSYLMKQVDEGRQEQIRVKLAASKVEGEEGKVFAAKFIKEAREGIEKEQAEKDSRRRIAEDNNIQLQQQMAFREHKEDLERQEIFLANKHMQYIEKKHRERLAEQGGAIRTKFPLKASQWYS